MRTPTPDSDLYLWWASALKDPSLERHEGEPQCGWYKRKAVKNGPWVPCEIVCKREIEDGALVSDETFVAILHDGAEIDADKIWLFVTPITFREWKQRMASMDGIATHVAVDLTENPARP